MKKLKKLNCVYIFYMFLMIIVMFSNLFLSNRTYAAKSKLTSSNIILLSIGIVIYFTIYIAILFFLKKRQEVNKNRINKILLVWSFLFVIILFFVGRSYSFETDWDVKFIIDNAKIIANGEIELLDNYYYSIYPNNVLITVIFSIAFKIANFTGVSSGYNYLLLLNCLILSFTGFLVFKIANILFNNDYKFSILTYILYILLIGISPWLVITYSDNIALGIATLCIYLFFVICQTAIEKKKKMYILLLGIVSMLGYYIKPQAFIVIIAIFILQILYNINKIKKDYKKQLIYILIFLSGIIVSFISVKAIKNYSGFKLNNDRKFGIAHFLMLGWNTETEGMWNQKDIDYSISFNKIEDRNVGNIKIFKERIKELGPMGVINLTIKKLLSNYNDGTFTWGGEGKFYVQENDTGLPALRNFFENIYWNDGAYYWIFANFMQIIWITTLFFAIFTSNLNTDIRHSTLMLTIIGLTLFQLIFECRARYLFLYTPIFILLGVDGLKNIEKKIKEHGGMK